MDITIKNEFLQITVNEVGAELTEIKSVTTGNDYLHNGDEKWWSFHAPILFPIVGRNKDDEFKINGKKYPIGKHGFARTETFVLTKESDTEIKGVLTANETTRKSFPFEFTLEVTYKLEGNKVTTAFRVVNNDEHKMIFAIGGHPAFKCPIADGSEFTDYYLEFEENETVKASVIEKAYGFFTDKEIPMLENENKLNLNYDLFAIDAVVLKETKSNKVTLKSDKFKESLTFDYGEFEHIAFWTKKDAPFLCIEPWFSHGDYINFDKEHSEKEGMVPLKPNEDFNAKYSVAINE